MEATTAAQDSDSYESTGSKTIADMHGIEHRFLDDPNPV